MPAAQTWIDQLGLQPHPEGGWFREVYRAAESIPQTSLPDRFTGDRDISTAIYFLLQGSEFSAFHRIRQDELWHHYDGGAIVVHVIDPGGESSVISLGKDLTAGQTPLAVIPAGALFAAELAEPSSYALVGCTVAPGFDFEDFQMPGRADLLAQYPAQRDLIERLSHD